MHGMGVTSVAAIRRTVIATLAALTLAATAAPALAQTPDPSGVPAVAYAQAVAAGEGTPYAPGLVNATFDTARWSLDETEKAPTTAVDAMRDASELAIATVVTAGNEIDEREREAEREAVAAQCWLVYGRWDPYCWAG